MTDWPHSFFVVAQAQTGGLQGQLIALFPFVLIVGIFYLLVLMPMRKRQKKVATFQSGLKVGDKVITTGGLFGQVTRVSNDSVQLQVADKVRVEVARSAVGGYQGQDPVVEQQSGGL